MCVIGCGKFLFFVFYVYVCHRDLERGYRRQGEMCIVYGCVCVCVSVCVRVCVCGLVYTCASAREGEEACMPSCA